MRATVRPCLALISLALLASPARGQFDDPKVTTAEAPPSGNSEIRDEVGLFGRDAVRENLARLVTIERAYRVPVTIETIESLKGEPIDEAILRYAKRLGPQGKGVFVLISKGDHRAEVRASRDHPALNVRSRQIAMRDAFLEEFRKGNFDAGLKRGVEAIEKTIAANRGDDSRSTERASETFSASHPKVTDSGPSSFVRRNQAKLTLVGAKRLVSAAEAKAAELGQKMNIAVVDDGGHLLAFSRMDDARPASIYTAITKATSAATYRTPTGPLAGGGTPPSPDALLNLSLQNAASASGGKITTLLGGVPIVVEGQVVGAIGLGGGTGEQDAEVARAAVAQFVADFAAPTQSSTPVAPASPAAPK